MAATHDGPAGAEAAIIGLEAEFPGWKVWRTTDAGTWWATRRGPQWNTEPRTVAGDTLDELRDELRGLAATAP